MKLSTVTILVAALATAHAEEPHPGAVLYKRLCAECHGEKGEGVAKKYDEPLFGERTVASLAKLIDRTMPEDEPEKCSAEESEKIAAYIYDAFYSAEARARNNPPKHELARLTNRQFRESVADLLGSFRKTLPQGPATGLRAEYFQSDGMNKKKKRAFDRQDKALDFDFGEGSPGEGITPDQFSIAWNGSLIAGDTGIYEFRLRTPNGARVYVNTDFGAGDGNFRDDSDAKRETPLIDAWVSSGEQVREETARIYLLGGRHYPFRLDYFKYKDKRGAVKLEWKPPGGVWTVLAAPYLSPSPSVRVAIVDTAFPADDGSLGYERGTSISKEWHEATTKSTLAIAAEVAARLGPLAEVKKDAPDRPEKLKAFAAKFAERAFRSPLTPELRTLYVDRMFAEGVAPEVAVKRSVIAVLKSPRFLYPEIMEPGDHAVAARLAMNLWDSIPDAPLWEAANKGELKTPEQVRAQAERMARDPRAKAKLASFFHHWLGEDEVDDVSKDAKLFPGFDPAVVADLRTSLDHFVEHVVWGEKSDYRELLLANYLFVNPRLAKFYGMTSPVDDSFQKLEFEPSQRSGIFTHPFLLSAFSYHKSSSPIHRGVFLTRHIMGRMLKQPNIAVEFKDDMFDPSLTMREKVTTLTKKESCMGCHSTINPLGFSLEQYDAVGRFRTKENNKPVNVATEYQTAEGEVVNLNGARDLAEHTATSAAARRGFVRHLFHYAIKQTPAAFGPETMQKLDNRFVESGFHVRNLFIEVAAVAAMNRPEPAKQASR